MRDVRAEPSADVVNPYNPEELDEVQGPTYASERPERELMQSVDEAAERTGLDFDSFDDFRVEDLEGSIAQTRRKNYRSSSGGEYVKTVLAADPEILDLDNYLKVHALLHENVHGKHFSGELYDTLVDRGMPRSEAAELESLMDEDRESLEGGTELITHFLDPDSESVGRSFYPDEMKRVEERLDGDSELLKEIDDAGRELIDEYREVYQVEVDEGLYRERGSFAGQEYDAMVLGENAEVYGEEVVQNYLMDENYAEDDYQEFADEGVYHDESVLENDIVDDYRE
jgi:hypothetical protein